MITLILAIINGAKKSLYFSNIEYCVIRIDVVCGLGPWVGVTYWVMYIGERFLLLPGSKIRCT